MVHYNVYGASYVARLIADEILYFLDVKNKAPSFGSFINFVDVYEKFLNFS